ncbi:hypothetical protein WQ53_02510 [Pseudoxanthomonas suwonensis]|uniref:Peptidase C14 caspase catalytic subunit p20 n=2 Tax=Pseudoxanthomonas suwonensis TaxID=314722 RepID=A0A0E3UM76_9GAMM|nr:hypothetical protein WQ53_02510 [Pseudoxanthomonas suwonensis]
MAAWAAAQGYATVLVHDRKHKEITVDLLRKKIAAAIKRVTDETELKRLVVFFAGHGAALAVGDQYWILTHWKKRPTEAIKVSSLQRMLEYYGPRQVAIIGDACQEFSASFLDIVGSPVLDMPDEEQRPYELDQFFAVDVGKQAFMIKAAGGQDDFCLFTEVLLDALEGDAAQASFEQIGQDRVVTSQSLARYLDSNVAQEAGKYGVRMIPRPKPGFYTDRTYLKVPPPATEGRPEPEIGDSVADAVLEDDASSSAGAAAPPRASSGRGGSRPGKGSTQASRAVERIALARPKAPAPALAARNNAIAKAREARRRAFADEVGSATVRDHFESGCGICVSGAEVAKVEASFGEESRVDGQPNWFRIWLGGESNSLGWSDTLVTLADGRIYSVCVVQGFVAALHVMGDGFLSLFHRPIGAGAYEGQMAIDLLAQAHSGLLSQEEIISTAAFLRHGKHRIITLGCIAAQFYDTIRDVDSLRSMASFYASHAQPVPLDIVLYGGGTISESEGRLYADIPAVAARKPRTPEEQRQSFTFDPTPGFERHPIAGRIPWMRQAWGAVVTANCDKSAEGWRKQALAAMAHLAPGAFTNVAPGGRQALVKLAGIKTGKRKARQLLSV